MQEAGVDVLLLVAPENLYYFTGFWGAAPIRLLSLLLTADGCTFVVPKLEEEYVRTTAKVDDVISYLEFSASGTPDDPVAAVASALRGLGAARGRIAIEGAVLPVSLAQRLQSALPDVRWSEANDITAPLRMIKDAGEIENARTAARLTDAKAAKAIEEARPGVTELELGLTVAYTAAKASRFLISPYNRGVPVVATGARSALPHGRASDTPILPGDLLVLDLCAIAFHDAYHAAFTRTVVVGRPTSKQQEIYDVVGEAQAAAMQLVRPGTPVADLDRAARTVIERAGYGDQFTHRTGRGVGLDVAEPPYLRQGETTELAPGMIISIEPGVYLSGYGGVRTEDTLLVTDTGHEVLTRYPRDFVNTMERGAEAARVASSTRTPLDRQERTA